MSLTELLPSIQALPRQEKFRLAQELLAELAQQEELVGAGVFTDQEYPLWSPSETKEAASTLLKLLAEDRANHA